MRQVQCHIILDLLQWELDNLSLQGMRNSSLRASLMVPELVLLLTYGGDGLQVFARKGPSHLAHQTTLWCG